MIFILSGPSGSGKTTLRDVILKDSALRGRIAKSVSLTTRPKRRGERQGKDYFFVSAKEFCRLRKSKKILEWTRYLGYYYGTKKDFLDAFLAQGKDVILCLDFKGAFKLKRLYPERTAAIFISPPSIKELRKRIEGRASGTKQEEIAKRLKLAAKELTVSSKYDYVLRNKDLAQAAKRLRGIILKKAGSLKKAGA